MCSWSVAEAHNLYLNSARSTSMVRVDIQVASDNCPSRSELCSDSIHIVECVVSFLSLSLYLVYLAPVGCPLFYVEYNECSGECCGMLIIRTAGVANGRDGFLSNRNRVELI